MPYISEFLASLKRKSSSLMAREGWLSYLGLLISVSLFIERVAPNASRAFELHVYEQKYRLLLVGQGMMSDNEIYAWAGWMYINGLSPDKFNFEHPPLAKYLIGLSERAFGSEALLGMALGVLTLLVVYFISAKILPLHFAVLPPAFLALDRLFLLFSSVSVLEIYSTFFVATYVLLFVLYRHSRWLWIPMGFTIGLAVASKWTGMFAIPALAVLIAIDRDTKSLRALLLSLPVAALTYTSTYAAYFLNGHSLQDFFALQFQILKFQETLRLGRGTPPPFWLLLNFLTGIEGPGVLTHVSIDWGARTLNTTSVEYGFSLLGTFNPLTWPFSLSASVLTIAYARKSHDRVALLPALVFFSFLGFTAYGQVFIWYILPALPFAFMSLSYMLWRITSSAKTPRTASFILAAYVAAVAVWSYYLALPFFIATV